MNQVKISIVSYLNSRPFLYGLQHSNLFQNIDLDMPSACANKLISGEIDLGLIPVADIPQLKEHYIISDFCIGADGKVGSVMLYSNVPLSEIETITLDYQSHSSIALTKVLANFFWKIDPKWIAGTLNYENKIDGPNAAVIIGDRTFGLENKYVYAYDLAEEWQKYTQLPFVFACWVSNKKLSKGFIEKFNAALKYGIDNRPALIKELILNKEYNTDVEDYLNNKIKYELDNPQKIALDLFLKFIVQLGK